MIRPRQYFPWKVGRKYLTKQIVFFVILAFTVGFSLRYFAYNLFSNAQDIPAAIGEFDRYITRLISMALVAGMGFQIYMNYVSLKPLGRLLKRARELRKGAAYESELTADDLTEEVYGEWLDLERALNRIHRDLREQTDELSTEREELSALLGAVSDAIYAVDIFGEALFFNTQFSILFSAHAQSEKKNTRLNEIFRSPEILDAFKDVLKTGQTKVININLRTSRQSINRHFNLSIAPLKNTPSEKVFGAVGIFHDVTELKQAEQIRIEFVGNASHELRTPLTSIKGYLETLIDDFKNKRFDSADHFFAVITKNVDRLMYLTNDLLDLSTIESGAELKSEILDTREVTENVLRQLDERRLKKNLSIEVQYVAESLFGDADRIEQVLINLVQNAIKYIPENRKIILLWENSEAGEVILRVRDNGPGIPREHQDRLFERFYRVDTGRSREQGGTGLGLSIVKHVMIKHGGRVVLKSENGEGAEFICYFPNENLGLAR